MTPYLTGFPSWDLILVQLGVHLRKFVDPAAAPRRIAIYEDQFATWRDIAPSPAVRLELEAARAVAERWRSDLEIALSISNS